jgi:trimeric autotransporter adhesin
MPDSVRTQRMKNQDYAPSTAIRQSGFIAQEVEQAAKACGYNFNGVHIPQNENDNYSVSYQTIVVPLVKAVQELNTKNEALQALIQELKKAIEILIKR